MLLGNPIKKLQAGQSKALAVFQKAKKQQIEVLNGIKAEEGKIAEKIRKEQEKQKELAGMSINATQFLVKINDFLGEDSEVTEVLKTDLKFEESIPKK